MVSFIAAAYKEKLEANVFLNSLLLQQNPNWECIVYCDEPNIEIKNIINRINDNRIFYYENETAKGYWGHDNRKYALENLVKGEFVVQASIQDYYLPITVTMIDNFSKNNDFIYFDCLHNGFSYNVLITQPQSCRIDWGSFAVRTEIAKKVGIQDTHSRLADGIFVEDIFKLPYLRYTKINKILNVHN